ncbi:MAG: S41 family peptidase [Candidatus Dojkabacteria bacterium]|jgi:C-terminal processing protease CtpA/Prc
MKLTEKTQNQEDIEYLQKQSEKTHFDLYRNISKEEFTSSLKKATEVKSEFFELAIQESLALLGDAHTYVYGTTDYELLPLRTKEIDGNFYIIGASREYEDMLGQRIEKINGYKLKDILEKVSRLSSKENKELLLKENAADIISNRVLRYYGFSNDSLVKITTEKGTRDVDTKDDSAIRTLNPFDWRKEDTKDPTFIGNEIYRFRILGNTLLFQYNECTNEGKTKEELKEFKKQLLEKVKSVKSIVVDLRQNGGGDTDIMEDLFNKLPENKNIYVAIGRNTYSSAIHHLLYLKNKKGAILIGENAGQKPSRFGDSKEFVLPHSQLKVTCSFRYFELLPGKDIDVIEPDIKIPVKIDNYINNIDPLNEWIKENMNSNPYEHNPHTSH